MSSIPSRAFSYSASRNAMASNAVTDINQGGGNKKAGLPPSVGIDSWTTIAFNERSAFNTLTYWRTPQQKIPLYSNSNLPIGTNPTIVMR